MNFVRCKNRLTDVKAIFFDFAGTLYELNDSVIDIWRNILIEEGINFDKTCFNNALKVARSALDKLTAKKVYSNQTPEMPFSYWISYHALMLKTMGIKEKHLLKNLSLKITQSMGDTEKKYKMNRNVKDILTILKQKYKIGVISNTTIDYRTYLREDGILHLFDVIGLSFEMGSWKPDKAIFWKCCREAQVSPQNCIYVGDTQICDIKGSSNAGMIPILIKDSTDSSKISREKLISINEISDLYKFSDLTEGGKYEKG